MDEGFPLALAVKPWQAGGFSPGGQKGECDTQQGV